MSQYKVIDPELNTEAPGFRTCPIPLAPEAMWAHRFYNNMTAQEYGPWILRLNGFDQIVTSQDVIIVGDEGAEDYFLAGALTAERSTTHFMAHREYGRFTRLAVWEPEAEGGSEEPLVFLRGRDWRTLLDAYWAKVLERYGVDRGPRAQAPLTGYCTWYYYYDDLSERQFLDNVRAVQANRGVVPCRYVQIDDGYQPYHGDWLEQNERWPTPLPETIGRLRDEGLEVGIWIMPFLASANSRVAREHPDWFVRDDAGDPVYVPGWSPPPNHNWQCLDATHPEALDYMREVFRRFREMGVTYFKLDGVGFSAQRGYRRDPRATGSSAFRKGLEAIREAAGDCWVLGCGGNYLPGLGVYDSIRVSCDTGVNYEPKGLPNLASSGSEGPQRHPDPVLPSLENAVRATLFNWWRFDAGYRCDPDVIIARDENCNLTENEARMSTLAGMVTGIAFTSDKLDQCGPDRLVLLGLAARARMADVRPARVERDGLLEVFTGTVGEAPAVALFNFSSAPKRYPADLFPDGPDGGGMADLLDPALAAADADGFEVGPHGGALLLPEGEARRLRDAVRESLPTEGAAR